MSLDSFIRNADQLVAFNAGVADGTIPLTSAQLLKMHISEFKALWERAKSSFEQFMTERASEEGEEEDGDEEVASERDTFQAKYNSTYVTYCTCLAKLSELLEGFQPPSVPKTSESPSLPSSSPVQDHGHSFRLPPCDTEVFNGDYMSWPTFRDMFTAVYIKNSSLSPVERLFHLTQKTRGEARDIVQRSPLTNPGFQLAWQNLCARFENKRILVNGQLKVLFNLPFIKAESASALKSMQRDINSCIAALNCFSKTHHVRNCASKNNCFECQKRHNTMLHDSSEHSRHSNLSSNPNNNSALSTSSVPFTPNSVQSTNSGNGVIQSCFTTSSRGVLLGTALVNVIHLGVSYQARVLLDSGSQGTFVSEKFFNKLKLPYQRTNMQISGLNNTTAASVRKLCSILLCSRFEKTVQVSVQAFVVPQLSGNLPSQTLPTSLFSRLPNIKLADPHFHKSSTIDLLVGGDFIPEIMRSGVMHNLCESLMGHETIFGWILTGPIPISSQSSTVVSNFCEISLDKEIRRFWEVENGPRKRFASNSDKSCEELFVSTTTRNKDGRYVIRLPFKEGFPNEIFLGQSRPRAVSQFLRNESRLLRTPNFKVEYDQVLDEYIQLKHMIPIQTPSSSANPSHYYMPHHSVVKPERSTTKVRVVFNASAPSSNGQSLNDILHIGPVLQNDLTTLILRWRLFQFVFNADIQKMYRQILVHSDHTPFQKIVFRNHPGENIQDFELQTVQFGVNCAPYLAIRTLLQLADDVQCSHPKNRHAQTLIQQQQSQSFQSNVVQKGTFLMPPLPASSCTESMLQVPSNGHGKEKEGGPGTQILFAGPNPSALSEIASKSPSNSPRPSTSKASRPQPRPQASAPVSPGSLTSLIRQNRTILLPTVLVRIDAKTVARCLLDSASPVSRVSRAFEYADLKRGDGMPADVILSA
ncbi:uncharacterized protein [Musca autumnalis]|uniref:uncharacterized protein n=1 Tax=Musca autumnalis TaxID=221902 RepID=UPI003CFB8B8E